MTTNTHRKTILVLGGTGKTGSRVAARLSQCDVDVRIGSRSGTIPFEWENPLTWPAALTGIDAVYIAYYPDLAAPGAARAIRALVEVATDRGVRQLVLLSGRGEPEAQDCETIVAASGLDFTVLRCSWFSQNFSEGGFVDYILAGEVALPAGDVAEPFVDVDDIADVAVTALTGGGHCGHTYELTGPRALTFAEAVKEIAGATGKNTTYVQIPHDAFLAGMREYGVGEDEVATLDYLFGTVLDGRNTRATNDIQRVLGREPKSFADYAHDAAASGIWLV